MPPPPAVAPSRARLRPPLRRAPDISDPAFAAEAHRQSALAAAAPREAEDQAFVDAISAWPNACDAATRARPTRPAAPVP